MNRLSIMNSRGISIIFLVIAMLLMITIGYVFSYLIPSKQKSVVFPIQSTQAFFIAQSGVEFAVKYALLQTPPWTTPALLNGLDGMTKNLGAGEFTLDYDEVNDRLTSTGRVPIGTERRRIVVSNFTGFLLRIDYFASASTPADSDSNTARRTSVVPPAGMQAGDLVLMIAQARAVTGTIRIDRTGGQTWTSEAQYDDTGCHLRLFWCRFNGAWTGVPSPNPRVDFTDNECNTLVMHVFRPSNTRSVWQLDASQVSGTHAGGSVTIPGITTVTDGAFVFATWASTDNNRWVNLTAGWFTPGSAQYRNEAGNDQSQTHAYRVMQTAGASGPVRKNEQGAGANDPGVYLINAFKAVINACP